MLYSDWGYAAAPPQLVSIAIGDKDKDTKTP